MGSKYPTTLDNLSVYQMLSQIVHSYVKPASFVYTVPTQPIRTWVADLKIWHLKRRSAISKSTFFRNILLKDAHAFGATFSTSNSISIPHILCLALQYLGKMPTHSPGYTNRPTKRLRYRLTFWGESEWDSYASVAKAPDTLRGQALRKSESAGENDQNPLKCLPYSAWGWTVSSRPRVRVKSTTVKKESRYKAVGKSKHRVNISIDKIVYGIWTDTQASNKCLARSSHSDEMECNCNQEWNGIICISTGLRW